MMTQASFSFNESNDNQKEEFKLNLEKPIAFFDLETTGINTSQDRIVEISILKILADGTKEKPYTFLINPGIAISPESTKVHGISDEDVKDKPTFKELAPELLGILDNCDLAGYNSNKFDIPLLMEEFKRYQIPFSMEGRRTIDVQNIFHKMEQRTLVAAYRFYCNKEIEKAHSAEADITATYEVLLAQLQKYETLNNDVNQLHEFSRQANTADLSGRILKNEEGKEIFNFGKYKGRLVEDIFKNESSYYSWMMNGEFPQDTKDLITVIYKRISKK